MGVSGSRDIRGAATRFGPFEIGVGDMRDRSREERRKVGNRDASKPKEGRRELHALAGGEMGCTQARRSLQQWGARG
jgi:hypothetical protein